MLSQEDIAAMGLRDSSVCRVVCWGALWTEDIRCCRWGLHKRAALKAFRDAVVKNLQTRFTGDSARFLGVCKLFNKSKSESSFTDDYVRACVRSVVANVAPVNQGRNHDFKGGGDATCFPFRDFPFPSPSACFLQYVNNIIYTQHSTHTHSFKQIESFCMQRTVCQLDRPYYVISSRWKFPKQVFTHFNTRNKVFCQFQNVCSI